MVKVQCSFSVENGKPSKVTVDSGDLPDGTFVIGWGIADNEEVLIVMFADSDGRTTLKAQAGWFIQGRAPQT